MSIIGATSSSIGLNSLYANRFNQINNEKYTNSSKYLGLNGMASYIYYGTGVNNAATSEELKSYLTDTKKYSDGILNTINSVSNSSNSDALVKATKDFVSNYNNLLNTADKYSDDSGAARLKKQLSGISSTYADSLSDIGIGVNKDGTLKIDEDTLKKVSENGKLKDYWNDNNNSNSYGFFNKAKNISSNIKNNSTYYLSSTTKNELNYSTAVSNYNVTSSLYVNSYCKYSVVGSLLDMMF